MPPADSLIQQQLEGHEDRLQRAETAVSTLAVTVGKIETGTQHIAEAVKTGFADLNKNHGELFKKLEEHGTTLAAQAQRLKPLEEHMSGQKLGLRVRNSRLKTGGLGVIVTGLGVVMTKGLEALWAWLHLH